MKTVSTNMFLMIIIIILITIIWRRSARKSRKEKVRNVTIREVMDVRKNILEVIEEKRLRWFGHVKRMPGNRLPLKVLDGNQREHEEGEDLKSDG
jgi:predicted membrane protein